MVLPVVVVLELFWVGVWLQSRVTEDMMGPEFSRPSTPDTPSTGTWMAPAPALIGMSLLQACTGTWLLLRFTRLSLLKPEVGVEVPWWPELWSEPELWSQPHWSHVPCSS